MEQFLSTLPALIPTSVVMIAMSLATLYVAKRSGLTDVQSAVGRESDRLVAAQAKRIELLEKKVSELEKELALAKEERRRYIERIDALERLISDEQLRKVVLKEI